MLSACIIIIHYHVCKLSLSTSIRVCLTLLFNLKRKIMNKKSKNNFDLNLPLMDSCCGAIDVGSTMMMVSYSDRDGNQNLLEDFLSTPQ